MLGGEFPYWRRKQETCIALVVTTLRQCPDKAPGHGNLEALGSLAVLEPPNDPPLQNGVGNSIGRQSYTDLQYRFFTETLRETFVDAGP